MEDITSPALGCFTKCVVDPIGIRFQVSRRHLEDNKKELDMSRDKLIARRDGKRRELDEEAKRQLEGVEESAEAKIWFTQVDHALSDFKSLQNKYEQRYLCRSRYKLSKKMLKLKQVIDKLYEAEPQSGWTTTPPPLQKGMNLDMVSIKGQPASEKLRHEIIDAVVDDRYVVVGLYGRRDVGKTTLLRHINEFFRQTNDFESVIFTTVSITPNFVKIRKRIAESLGLKNCQDDTYVKLQLSRLLQTRKYLLILDDIWEPFDLGELYIPAPTKENGCKILMASRLLSVITRFVIPFAPTDSLHLIPMNGLPPDEAWNHFVQKVGSAIISKPEIYPLAKEVLRNCDGLPLKIITIGEKMSTRETEREWKDVLRELEKHSASNLEETMRQQQQQQEEDVKFTTHSHTQKPVVLGDDILEFLRRMNRSFVNEAGTYLKFEFRGSVFSGPRRFNDNLLRYYDKDIHLSSHPFSQVQCNANEDPQPLIQPREVQIPIQLPFVSETSATRIVTQSSLGYDSAFTYNGYCFIGRIRIVSDTFRDTDVINMFFRLHNLGPNCYVDAKATTLFVLSNRASHFSNSDKVEDEMRKRDEETGHDEEGRKEVEVQRNIECQGWPATI